ncbi:transglycosylase domain-containing protein [Herbiconiux sp. CPCC 205716]|uniref:Transglycosylase domain-containing protein n=1 Tax=Herbiconiux gentiana TaxID=2970912 RepID=A0ABT2GCQ0_9MICO|nr:transglycosylase domain-containing protein [Herbiconiux gentiana]MCS5713995.1 transglycosylase domain-containing protein [Herbiconiux gentiana]
MPEAPHRLTSAFQRLIDGTKRPVGMMLALGVASALLVTVMAVPAVAVTGVYASRTADVLDTLPDYIRPSTLAQNSEIYATNSDGTQVLLATVFDQNRQEVGWDDISPYVKDAVVTTEDPRFYEHAGVDIASTLRAALGNVASGGVESGASTITMQYVRNILVQQAESLDTKAERDAAYEAATTESVDRKLTEMRLAIALEKQYSKNDILLGYLNIANFGGSVYGIQAAAEYYYGVSAKDLSVAQAASLAATVNEPNGLRIDEPENIPDNQARRDEDVLASMLKHKAITQQQYDEAIATPVTPVITAPTTGCQAAASGAAYFCDYVTYIVRNDATFGDTSDERWSNFKRGGYKIYTTLNTDLQWNADSLMKEYVPASSDEADLGSTIVTVEPGTGRILAMAQNTNYAADPDTPVAGSTALNYNTDIDYGGSSGFQVGSTYKVFALAEWLKQGHTLSDRVSGNEREWDQSTFPNSCQALGGPWEPANDGSARPGTMSVQNALTNSVNNAFIAMAQQLDLCAIKATAESLGVHRADGNPLDTQPSSVLGTNEIAPLTMAAAYAAIAANGVYCAPVAIDRIVGPDGQDVQAPQANCQQTMDPSIASTLAYAMLGPIEEGTAVASNPEDGITHIGKTGTTDNEKDTWMVGASTKAATAVWVGNVTGDVSMTDVYPNGYLGSTVRHRIWNGMMTVNDEVLGGDDFPEPNEELVDGSSERFDSSSSSGSSNSDSGSGSGTTPSPSSTSAPSAPVAPAPADPAPSAPAPAPAPDPVVPADPVPTPAATPSR